MAQEKNVPENVTFTIPLIDLDVYNKRINKRDEVIDTIFNVIPWTRISFPVCTYRKHVTGNDQDKGNSVVGVVNDVDPEENQIIVTIFGKHADTISYFENAVVMPSVNQNDKGETVIRTLVIGPQSDWEWMTKPQNKRFNGNKKFNRDK